MPVPPEAQVELTGVSHLLWVFLKKLSFKRKCWLDAQSQRTALSKRRVGHGRGRRTRLIRITYENSENSGVGFARDRVAMPSNFCLEQNYEETAECLALLRKNLSMGRARASRRHKLTKGRVRMRRTIKSYSDFTTIDRCSPSAALVMAAAFDQSRAVTPWAIPVIDRPRWKPELVAMLDEIGFFRLLGIPPAQVAPSVNPIQILQFQTGALVARDEAAQLTDTLKQRLVNAVPRLGGDEAFETTVMQLLGAIQEATENACDHAYRESSLPKPVQRWWATGAIDVQRRHLNLIVYDQGKSIPATLPNWERYPFVASRLARFQHRIGAALGDDELDAIKMRLAMDAPRSSTNAAHRGKGFVLFRTVIEQSKAGRLRILSRNGEFIYEKGSRPRARALKTPLRGTLVEWDIWL